MSNQLPSSAPPFNWSWGWSWAEMLDNLDTKRFPAHGTHHNDAFVPGWVPVREDDDDDDQPR